MKLIKSYIRYRKTEEVYNALKKAGFDSITFVDCEGTGQYSDRESEHISEKYPFANAFKVIKLEILVADEKIDELVTIIKKHGKTGYRGDGIIIVTPVENVYKIRTDEEGINAI
ncbi:MAG: P-II family nitrogen regulator [Bacteroidales bacterium]|jgi:nitrogen regulatory protein P-II 1|nr:P-II family nitrogen regulator [Bacteroidales bacterium]